MKKEHLVAAIIAETLQKPTALEVKITGAVSKTMKQRRAGLFQNEVDYRILVPDFESLENDCHAKKSYRADLVGYSKSGFTVAEFKIYDEEKRTKNPWGVIHFLRRDIARLNKLAETNHKLWGDLIFIVAIRNADFDRGEEQQELMRSYGKSKSKKPPLRKFRYYPVLLILDKELRDNATWNVELKKRGGTAFLIASRKF